MHVELQKHLSTNIATGRQVQFKQYRVVVDGTTVAYKSWATGSKICFVGRVSPLDREEIEKQVGNLLGGAPKSVQPPDVSKEDLDKEEEHYDDFDEDVSAE